MLIVGAGTAGPALGFALQRAGIKSIVYEASDSPRDDAGAFLNAAPNGLSVLRTLGLSRQLDRLGFQNDRLVFHNETGRVLAEVPVGGVTVLRGALSRAVREAAEDTGVRFEFGKALSSVTEQNGEEPPRGTLLNAHTDRYRRQLLAVHQSDPPEVTRILEASGDIGAWPVYDILSLPAWYRGAVCLLGDAAHAVGPHVGQGAALALEDALVLAKCLRDIPDASHSFSTFEHMRRPRVEPVVKQSRRTGQQKAPAGWVGRKIRDLILPTFLKSSARAANELYRHAIDWEERVA